MMSIMYKPHREKLCLRDEDPASTQICTASALFDLGLRFPLLELLDTVQYIDIHCKPWVTGIFTTLIYSENAFFMARFSCFRFTREKK